MVFARFLSAPLLVSVLLTLGCRAQQPGPGAGPAAATATAAQMQAGTPLSPELKWKVESMLREKADLPPESTVQISGRTSSDFPDFDDVTVTVAAQGHVSRPILFLLSKDNKTLAQLTRFDLSGDPREAVSGAGRPSRGGTASAPVQIVGFDDLECPYCARLHDAVFPAITQRYGDKVRIVYKDFPLPPDQHPWATRAAVDVNCLASQSDAGYWAEVDAIHAHPESFGADPKDPKAPQTLARADEQLDALTRQEGESHKADMPKLNACLTKQDQAGVDASREVGEKLGVSSTPTLFINGNKITGAVSLAYLFGMIDEALRVAGVQPPPPYTAPATPALSSGSSTAPAGR